MSEADLTSLFIMYGRLKDAKKLNPKGVGLGLSISNELAKLLGQNRTGIEVESREGIGSKFSFTIPRQMEEENCYDDNSVE